MVRLHLITGCVLALCLTISVSATTYLPVTFNDLVTRADVVFVGEVTDVRPFPLQTRDGTIIKTRVIFRVSDALLGTTSALEILEFLGGELNGIRMVVAEMPTFAIGDRRVVFARRERSINPIVGFTQGLLTIRRDQTGVDRVFTLDGYPLARLESIGTLRNAGTDAAMRLADFRERISLSLTQLGRR